MIRAVSLSRMRYLLLFGLLFFSASLGTWLLPRILNPVPPSGDKRKEDKQWVASSHYWLDRQACRWLSLCGVQHLRLDPPAGKVKSIPSGSEYHQRLSLELRHLAIEIENLTSDGDSLFYDDQDPVQFDDEEGDEGSPNVRYRNWQLARKPSLPRPTPNPDAESSRNATVLRDIPQYVLDHAPLVHLCSDEHFWPSDIAEHVRHMGVAVDNHDDGMKVITPPVPLSLDSLSQLNNLSDTNMVFFVSNDDVESRPDWLFSTNGRPHEWEDDNDNDNDDDDDDDDNEHDDPPNGNPDPKRHPEIPNEAQWLQEGTTWYDVKPNHPLNRITDPRRLQAHIQQRSPRNSDQEPLDPGSGDDKEENKDKGKPDANGRSSAPATLVVVDKGNGIVDAFWFFFYSYNLGQTVLNIRFGNHVGDWEHAMVRFENGVPRGVFFSEHEGGQAYAWGAVEKRGQRPVIYSAVGSHAMYAMPGLQPYILPFKMLKDVTDRGPLWDPAKNSRMYFYEFDRPEPENSMNNPDCLTPAAQNPDAPVDWFFYTGAWGDRLYTLADKRQWRLFGQYHYVNGPTGPIWKNLNRERMCQTKRCTIAHSLTPGRTWYG